MKEITSLKVLTMSNKVVRIAQLVKAGTGVSIVDGSSPGRGEAVFACQMLVHDMSKAVGVLDSVPSDPEHIIGCRHAYGPYGCRVS